MGGDSGGPLFDMQGRVIAINSWITEDVTENFHGSARAFGEAWEQLVAGQVYPPNPVSRFLNALDADSDGRLSRDELPEGYRRDVFDRLAAQFGLDPDESHSIEEFATGALDWRNSPRITFARRNERGPRSDGLLPDLYVRGKSIRRVLVPFIEESSKSVVRIQSDGDWVCQGMIVDRDGLILTKASVLGSKLACTLSDGRKLSLELVVVEERNDLALLNADAEDLTPISWSNQETETGNWLVSPDSTGGVASVGVLSVAVRQIEKTPAVLGVQIDRLDGSTTVVRVEPRTGAAEAGIEPGDRITKIMEQDVHDLDGLREALLEFRAGDVVTATILREEETLTFDVTLWAPEDVFFRFRTSRMNGPVSRRRDGFEAAIQHDSVLRPSDCGGPVLDMSGKVVGMNIARASRIATYALPQELLQTFVHQHRSTETPPSKPDSP